MILNQSFRSIKTIAAIRKRTYSSVVCYLIFFISLTRLSLSFKESFSVSLLANIDLAPCFIDLDLPLICSRHWRTHQLAILKVSKLSLYRIFSILSSSYCFVFLEPTFSNSVSEKVFLEPDPASEQLLKTK